MICLQHFARGLLAGSDARFYSLAQVVRMYASVPGVEETLVSGLNADRIDDPDSTL